MPELPEVETIRRQLAPVVEGARIDSLDIVDPRWCAPVAPERLADELAGKRIERLDRRGKYFVFEFADGSALLLHLRMTGNLLFVKGRAPAPAHLRATIRLARGGRLAFVDPRRFGTAEYVQSREELGDFLHARLGPEPFSDEFSPEALFAATRGRTAPVKAFLLDQRRVAGVGNIYADEALYRARISPSRRAGKLTKAEAARLRDTVREALQAGIDAKGASIDDFRDAYGVQGSFQDQFLVHRRAGRPCPSCGSPVEKTRVAGRGTYLCRRCQR